MDEALEGCQQKHVCIYVKRDVCLSGKRRVYSTYEWAMFHEWGTGGMSKETHTHMSKETYVYLKRDVFTALTNRPFSHMGEGCQKKYIYVYVSKETYVYSKRDVFTAHLNGPCHTHGRGTWEMLNEKYVCMSKEIGVHLSEKTDVYVSFHRRIHMAKDTYTSVERDLWKHQKGIIMSHARARICRKRLIHLHL